jgi:hypothetical protein
MMNPRSQTCGACATKGRKNPSVAITLICENCTEPFQLPQWRINQGRGRFCSRPCANEFLKTINGKDHHKYTTGKVAPSGYAGMNYKEARKAVLARAGGICEWCGVDLSTVKRWCVHHHIGLHKFDNPDDGNTPDNLAVICMSCHAKHHRLGKMPLKGGDANE